MNLPALLAEMQNEGQIEKISRTFGVDWTHLTAQIVSFCIVCAVLYFLAYRPILKMLDERRRQIAQGLANAEQIKAELARTEAQRQEVLLSANAQATRIIEEAQAAASRLQKRESEAAMATAEQILSKSRQAAMQDYARMTAELKREVGRLVVQTTAQVTGRILTADDQRRLEEETIKRMAA
ncbi:MAG TPA: F0F1 ATP synthase subunit B [Candidatus Angelobacter sp.]